MGYLWQICSIHESTRPQSTWSKLSEISPLFEFQSHCSDFEYNILVRVMQYFSPNAFVELDPRERSGLTEKWWQCKSFSITSQWEPFQLLGILSKLFGPEKYQYSILSFWGQFLHFWIYFQGVSPITGRKGFSVPPKIKNFILLWCVCSFNR